MRKLFVLGIVRPTFLLSVSCVVLGASWAWAELDWFRHFSSNYAVALVDVQFDTEGNIYTVGTGLGNVDLDPGPGIELHTFTSFCTFVVKLDPGGNYISSSVIGRNGFGDVYGSAFALHGGNLYICGEYSGTVDFDPGSGTTNHTSTEDNEAFVMQLSTDFDFAWADVYTRDGS